MLTVVETRLFQRQWPLYEETKTDNLTGPKLKEIRRALEE
jgi:hypothetical protein